MRRRFFISVLLGTLLVLLGSSPSMSAETVNKQPTTAADINREMNETLQAIGNYSAEQRDAAVTRAKDSLAKIDKQIEELQRTFDENRKSMSAETRKKSEATLNAMRKQRTEIAEWYGGLKHSSANAWDEIKKGFSQSYRELAKSMEKAGKEF